MTIPNDHFDFNAIKKALDKLSDEDLDRLGGPRSLNVNDIHCMDCNYLIMPEEMVCQGCEDIASAARLAKGYGGSLLSQVLLDPGILVDKCLKELKKANHKVIGSIGGPLCAECGTTISSCECGANIAYKGCLVKAPSYNTSPDPWPDLWPIYTKQIGQYGGPFFEQSNYATLAFVDEEKTLPKNAALALAYGASAFPKDKTNSLHIDSDQILAAVAASPEVQKAILAYYSELTTFISVTSEKTWINFTQPLISLVIFAQEDGACWESVSALISDWFDTVQNYFPTHLQDDVREILSEVRDWHSGWSYETYQKFVFKALRTDEIGFKFDVR